MNRKSFLAILLGGIASAAKAFSAKPQHCAKLSVACKPVVNSGFAYQIPEEFDSSGSELMKAHARLKKLEPYFWEHDPDWKKAHERALENIANEMEHAIIYGNEA